MKSTLLILLILSAPTLYGQNTDSLGLGSAYYLNKQEITYFDSIFEGIHNNFSDKKVAFLAGESKTIVISKKDFFDRYIIPYAVTQSLPKFTLKGLDENEKSKSGGFDFLFMTHAAATNKKIYKELSKLKSDN